MSTYGLKVLNAASVIIIDDTSKLNRCRYTTVATANVADSVVLADIDGQTTVELAIAINPTAVNDVAHNISRSGTTISWTVPTGPVTNKDSLILVFFYV